MFTTFVAKPKISEVYVDTPKPAISESFALVPKPNISETWILVKLWTAPSSPVADIAEADVAQVDDSADNMRLSE